MVVRTSKRVYPINFKRSALVIAIAQLAGPLPEGKHRTVIGNREALQWQSLEVMDARIEKACGILDYLNQLSQKPDVVVFSEYSLPVERALPKLRAKAEQHQQIIIPGADTFYQAERNKIINQAPIIIPGQETLWVKKRSVSDWERGLIDEPTQPTNPVLTWKVADRPYWLSVYLGRDFLLVPPEPGAGPGLFIVPACLSDSHSVKVHADTLLQSGASVATVLCNSVGESGAPGDGRSGVIVNALDDEPLIELSEAKESVAIFELDCTQLIPSKVAEGGMSSPLGKRQLFTLQTTTDEIKLIPVSDPGQADKPIERAVINPAIFDLLGKKMRMAFLEVDKYAELAETVKDQDFEVLAILGQHDLLVTHLHENRYDMIYDVTQVIPMKTALGTNEAKLRENFPFFRVDVYFKVLGVQVSPEDRAVFDGADKQVPTVDQLTQILRLGSNWADDEVPQEARDKFIENRWILDKTMTQPGKIGAVMTIYLDHAAGHMTELHADFEDRVLPELASMPTVTSIYRGRAVSLSIHYLLRITADVAALFSLIDEVHKLALKARVLVTTTTYVVVNKMSNLSLQRAVLLPALPPDEAHFRSTHILSRLSAEDRVRAIYLPQKEQLTFIQQYRNGQNILRDLSAHPWLQAHLEECQVKLATGLLHRNFNDLKLPHDLLQQRVEKLLVEFIDQNVTDEELDAWRGALNISPGKKKSNLTYSERIRLAIRAAEERPETTSWLADVRNLTPTAPVRNASAHGDWEARGITLETYIDTLQIYYRFLLNRDHE